MIKFSVACRSRRSLRLVDKFRSSECDPMRNMEESSQEDCLPFFLDDDSSGPEGSPSFLKRRSSMKSTYGFSLDTKVDKREAASTTSNNVNLTSRYGSAADKLESTSPKLDSHRPPSNRNLIDPLKTMEQRSVNTRSRGTNNPDMFSFSSHVTI